MTRPKTVSDESILQAALDLLGEKGASFTLTDIAQRVGLSRATLIQRFGNREAILVRMSQQNLEWAQKNIDIRLSLTGKGHPDDRRFPRRIESRECPDWKGNPPLPRSL